MASSGIDFKKYGIQPLQEEEQVSAPNLSSYGIVPMPGIQEMSTDEINKEKLNYYMGAGRTPIDTARDVLGGVVGGLGRGGQLIASALSGGKAPTVDFNKIQSAIASPTNSFWGNMAQGAGQALPYLYAGGPSLPGLLTSGATSGYINAEPNQRNLFGLLPNGRAGSAIEGALLNSLFHFGGKFLPKSQNPMDYKYVQKFTFPSSKSEFTNVPFSPPSFLNEQAPPALSPNIAQTLHQNIIGDRSLEDSGKELAKEINENYSAIKGEHQDRYNTIFNTPTENFSYQKKSLEPIKVRDSTINQGDYEENYSDHEFTDKSIQNLHDKYMENKSVQNAHKFQSELGSEISYLNKQKSAGTLDDLGKNKLSTYISMRQNLKNDIFNKLSSIDPKLGEDYQQVTSDWEKNVIPYHSNKNLKNIAEGKNTNPTSSQIVSIFKNPGDSINKVSSDLSQNGKNRIIHLGMGKNRYQNTPDDMIRGANSIETKGLSSYLHPAHDEMIKNLRNNVATENQAKLQAENNQKLMNSLREMHERAQNESAQQSSNALTRYQAAENEAKRIASEHVNALTEAANKPKSSNALRSIIGAVAGASAMHVLNSPELLGGYLGSKIGKHVKRKIVTKLKKI